MSLCLKIYTTISILQEKGRGCAIGNRMQITFFSSNNLWIQVELMFKLDFFLDNFYPFAPFNCIFSKISPIFFLCWLWLTPVPEWVHRIMDAGSHVECPQTTTPKHVFLFFWTCVLVFLGLCSKIVDMIWVVVEEQETCGIMTYGMDN